MLTLGTRGSSVFVGIMGARKDVRQEKWGGGGGQLGTRGWRTSGTVALLFSAKGFQGCGWQLLLWPTSTNMKVMSCFIWFSTKTSLQYCQYILYYYCRLWIADLPTSSCIMLRTTVHIMGYQNQFFNEHNNNNNIYLFIQVKRVQCVSYYSVIVIMLTCCTLIESHIHERTDQAMNFMCMYVWHRSCPRQEASLATGKFSFVFPIPKLSFWMRNDVRCFTVWFISSDVLQKIKWSTTICTCVYLITVFYLVYFTMKVCHAGKLEGQHCVSNVWHIFCDPSCTRKYQFLHMFPATKINLLYILIEQKMKKGVIVIKTQMNQVYLCLWWIWLSIKDNTFSSCFVAQSNLIIRKLRNLDRDLAIHVACAMHRSMHLT